MTLRIALAYNRRLGEDEGEAEHLDGAYIEDVREGLLRLGHDVQDVEMGGSTQEVIATLQDLAPDLVFNLAEGQRSVWREAYGPLLYRALDLPYTGSDPGTLRLALDKRLLGDVLRALDIRAPHGVMLSKADPLVPDGLTYPVLVKPNHGGSSMGIHQASVVHGKEEAQERVDRLLADHPSGVDVESFIAGRELTVSFLAHAPRPMLPIVETTAANPLNILDYEAKQERVEVRTQCPADIPDQVAREATRQAARALRVLGVQDMGRVDMRLDDAGRTHVLEVNPLPGLRRNQSPFMAAARQAGIPHDEVLACIVGSAMARQRPQRAMEAEVLR